VQVPPSTLSICGDQSSASAAWILVAIAGGA
jgi:hypothetical protein